MEKITLEGKRARGKRKKNLGKESKETTLAWLETKERFYIVKVFKKKKGKKKQNRKR